MKKSREMKCCSLSPAQWPFCLPAITWGVEERKVESQYYHSLCNVGDIFILSFSADLQGDVLRGGRLQNTESKPQRICASFRADNIFVAVYLQIVVLASDSFMLPQALLAGVKPVLCAKESGMRH